MYNNNIGRNVCTVPLRMWRLPAHGAHSATVSERASRMLSKIHNGQQETHESQSNNGYKLDVGSTKAEKKLRDLQPTNQQLTVGQAPVKKSHGLCAVASCISLCRYRTTNFNTSKLI